MNSFRNTLIFISLVPLLGACTYRFYAAGCDYPLPGKWKDRVPLEPIVHETSGLMAIGDELWTMNDSGGDAALYCVDPESGRTLKKKWVVGAENRDWEDLASSDRWLYVADIGNNLGTRDTLVIYRIGIDKMAAADTAVVHDGVITVSFDSNPTTSRKGRSSMDCEALVAFGDSLFLFTKDWDKGSTTVYAFPGIPGHHVLVPGRHYQPGIRVTGADLSAGKKEVVLVGYRCFVPVLITYKFQDNPAGIECGGAARTYPLKIGRQTEGVCFAANGGYFISSEGHLFRQALFKVSVSKR